MENIQLFAKIGKELETLIQAVRIYSRDTGMEFLIEKYAMLIMKNGKRQKTEGTELSNQEKIRMLGEKETKNIGSGHCQINEDERKKLKRVFSENEKTSRNKAISQKSHQKDKRLC